MKKIKKLLVIVVAACTLFCMFGCSLKDYFEKIDSTLDGYINGTSSSEMENSSSERPSTSSSEMENNSSERPSASSSETENSSSEKPSSSSSETENSSSSDVEDEETDELTMPDNVLDYVSLGLEVNKSGTLYLDDDSSTDYGAIWFLCSVSNELKAEVDKDENKSFGMLICPLSYFDRVNTENYAYMDWITVFNETGNSSYILGRDLLLSEESDGRYSIGLTLTKLGFSLVNKEIVAMGVLITTDSDGNETYKYSTYASGDYRTNARSLGYVAAESLNKYALGKESYTADQIELCKTYVNWSVDRVNGLTEPTDDDSTYTITVSPTEITMNVGKTYTVNVKIAEGSRVPVAYKSLDESVATVSETGEIKAVSAGNTTIAVYVAGVPYLVSITIK